MCNKNCKKNANILFYLLNTENFLKVHSSRMLVYCTHDGDNPSDEFQWNQKSTKRDPLPKEGRTQ